MQITLSLGTLFTSLKTPNCFKNILSIFTSSNNALRAVSSNDSFIDAKDPGRAHFSLWS